ncbi:extensin-like [Stegodyphus dumicola]|uniref:extensin-like n=1 Tax=Stegodyphus dumicola TaxID=202533 RepID=UPI0015B17E19|nr:extensin-like [Stegodyphus dumicola]
MGRLAVVFLICLTLHCVLSYWHGQQSHPPRVVYRHHYAPYPPNPQPAPFIGPVPARPPGPIQYGPPLPPLHGGAAAPVPFFARPPPPPPHPMYNHVPYAPAASHHHSLLKGPHIMPPPSSPRYPFKNVFGSPYHGAYSQQVPRPSIFAKIKPFLFGGTGPRSLPHHPYYPNHYYPHHFTPNRPLQNRPVAHHGLPVHHPSTHMHHPATYMKPEKSCSCSLHVGQLTVYKHTDMRSSYSCTDLKDCNSFCTNLFSSEDLRAQTRSDACLILGKDTTVPWFRRDHACEPHGAKNDTKLSVDLCCKNLQPC